MMRVLVADDDDDACLLAKAVVEAAGHECRVATSGDVAWEMFLRYQPDVLVTDWMMPGLDGLALCRAVRAHDRDRYTYIVMSTSRSSHGAVLAGLEAGADDYLVKPLDPLALQGRLLVASRVTALHEKLAAYRSELAETARTDELTELSNRRKLGEDLPRLHARSARYDRPYSLALCDIDHFKRYNDIHGHPAGDRALKAVAATLTAACRDTDALYRYGGEEFLVLMPEQRQDQAVAAVERLRASVAGLRIEHEPGATSHVTLSAGVASFDPDRPVDVETLVREADLALYRSKSTGRNRTTAARDGVVPAGLAPDSVALPNGPPRARRTPA